MDDFLSNSPAQTQQLAQCIAAVMPKGTVLALYGGLGMGKTAFVRGLAQGLGLQCEVTSPTFSLVHDYGGSPPLYHFDMYRVESWDALYSTGFFDYLDSGANLVIEWSENIRAALPPDRLDITFIRGEGETERRIQVKGVGKLENFIY